MEANVALIMNAKTQKDFIVLQENFHAIVQLTLATKPNIHFIMIHIVIAMLVIFIIVLRCVIQNF